MAAHSLDLLLFLFVLSPDQRAPQQDWDQNAEDYAFLERAAPVRSKAFENADPHSADGSQRIAAKTADDGGDERLEPNEEAGVVVDGRHRADQQPRHASKQRGEHECNRSRVAGTNAYQPRARWIDGSGAQSPVTVPSK